MLSYRDREHIQLLLNPDVIAWIYRDTNFLGKGSPSQLKRNEDAWGRELTKHPSKKNQWSGPFGERLVAELYRLCGHPLQPGKKKNHLICDFHGDDYDLEIKTGTFYTSGTAHEKLLFAGAKYIDAISKPLLIVLIGRSQKEGECQGLIGTKQTPSIRAIMDAYSIRRVRFIAFTELLELMIRRTTLPYLFARGFRCQLMEEIEATDMSSWMCSHSTVPTMYIKELTKFVKEYDTLDEYDREIVIQWWKRVTQLKSTFVDSANMNNHLVLTDFTNRE
jgi:hypothetical protein